LAGGQDLSHIYDVVDISGLNDAIKAIDLASQAATGAGVHYVINLAANTTIAVDAALYAINLRGADSLDIEGHGGTLDGKNNQRGLFVYAGAVTIEDLTIENMKAIGGAGA
jgi:hypothetical protein